MFAITYIGQHGMRTLAFANQGRNHYETREQADEFLELYKPDLAGRISNHHSLEVREVTCYDHGDAVSIYFD